MPSLTSATRSSTREYAMQDNNKAPLLAVRELSIAFRTERGRITTVNGVSFEIGNRELSASSASPGQAKP
jgi:ABC-type microcin C transport system duplicated ATPase subunit YejF